MLGALSRLPSWELDRDEEDIRGWALRDGAGHVLGTVGELIVDTRTESVVQVVLGDGKKFSAHDVFVGDHFLTLTGGPEKTALRAPRLEGGPSVRRRRSTSRAEVPARAAPVKRPSLFAPSRSGPYKRTTPDLVLPLIDEEIDVSKRRFDAGGVRIDAHVVTKPVRPGRRACVRSTSGSCGGSSISRFSQLTPTRACATRASKCRRGPNCPSWANARSRRRRDRHQEGGRRSAWSTCETPSGTRASK